MRGGMVTITVTGLRLKHIKRKQGKFLFKMCKKFFPLGAAERWKGLARDDVDSPSLENFETYLDEFLCHLLQVTPPWSPPEWSQGWIK